MSHLIIIKKRSDEVVQLVSAKRISEIKAFMLFDELDREMMFWEAIREFRKSQLRGENKYLMN